MLSSVFWYVHLIRNKNCFFTKAIIALVFIFFTHYNCASAQNTYDNFRSKKIVVLSDTIQLDSLSILPNSFQLKDKHNTIIDTSYYGINKFSSQLIINRNKLSQQNIPVDTFLVFYRTFPFLLTKKYEHKNSGLISVGKTGAVNPFVYRIEKPQSDIFRTDGLNKNGSISRGISFGNNQDVVVNSNLNLQVAGKLTDKIDVLVAVTDNSVPIQPEGNTQLLQDFDRVFIQLSDQKTKLIAGDYQINYNASNFMRYNKKAQGGNVVTSFVLNEQEKDTNKRMHLSLSGSAAISRGKFARNVIQGIERNQGPYILRGSEGETFIVVLSGTEKVYIDGELIQRGQENDYVIDYNTAQITFTAKRLITNNRRIVVEFQYSDRNYVRTLFQAGADYRLGNFKMKVNTFSEQDNKNQPLQQELNDAQKKIVAAAGDNIALAVTPSIDSIAFTTTEVLYKKIDTLINFVLYKDVYVYSTNPTAAKFRLKFSRVAKGNYKQISSSANGRVYQWIQPIAGEPQGEYEPVIQLVSAKQKQMAIAGAEYKKGNTLVSIEAAVTNDDVNTFSTIDKANDIGSALKLNIDNNRTIKTRNDSTPNKIKSWKLSTNINYEFVQQNFAQIERFRAVEFERDWSRTTTLINSDQHIIGAGITLSKPNLMNVNYKFNTFQEGSFYAGNKHALATNINNKGFSLKFNGSWMNSKALTNADFLRNTATVSQRMGFLIVGVDQLYERNLVMNSIADTLNRSSFEFLDLFFFSVNADTTKTKVRLQYRHRNDYSPFNNKMLNTTFAQEGIATVALLKNSNNQFTFTGTYRVLEVKNTAITTLKPDQTLLGRLEHNLSVASGFFTASTFYEFGSGQEVKREFSYIEVGAGLGTYAWNDYNKNDIKELNEFEIAAFKDQARYIRVFTPTNQTITVYTNQFSEVINIRPAAKWAVKKGIKKAISLFANQTAFKTDKRTIDNDLWRAYNPFKLTDSDTSTKALNASFRNSIFFNQLSPVFGMEFTYQENRNTSLLTNGIDTRVNIFRETKIRWNITRTLSINMSYKDGNKLNTSQFFTTRNYDINYFEIEPKFNIQPNTSFRWSFTYKYSEKSNSADYGAQTANQQNFGTELRYNILQKASLTAKANYIQLRYNDVESSAIAFEMLEGLRIGKNITWGLVFQQNFANNFSISINYDGRQSENSNIIHTGGAQARVFF